MDVYLNDYDFEGQALNLGSDEEVIGRLKRFSKFCGVIKNRKKSYSKLQISFLAQKHSLASVLSVLDSKEFTSQFLRRLDRVNVKYLDESGKSIISNNHFYFWINFLETPPSNIDVSQEMLAEATERLRTFQRPTLVLNLSWPLFDGQKEHRIHRVRKGSSLDIEYHVLECTDSSDALDDWIHRNLDMSKYSYSSDSKVCPTPYQTCLRDTSNFEKTNNIVQGQRVYKNKGDGTLWYVDNLHKGASAHLEVFDSKGNHIGEASLDGALDTKKADPKKKLSTK